MASYARSSDDTQSGCLLCTLQPCINCWERADLLVLFCVVFSCVFAIFPYGVVLVVPNICLLPYCDCVDSLSLPSSLSWKEGSQVPRSKQAAFYGHPGPNWNCPGQFHEIPWNQIADVYRGSSLRTRVIM